eukprot:g40551.t1
MLPPSLFEPRTLQIGEYLAVLGPYENNVNLIRARVSFTFWSRHDRKNVEALERVQKRFGRMIPGSEGPDPQAERPPILLVKVRRGWNTSPAEIAKEFATFCSLDVRKESSRQYLLATNEWK